MSNHIITTANDYTDDIINEVRTEKTVKDDLRKIILFESVIYFAFLAAIQYDQNNGDDQTKIDDTLNDLYDYFKYDLQFPLDIFKAYQEKVGQYRVAGKTARPSTTQPSSLITETLSDSDYRYLAFSEEFVASLKKILPSLNTEQVDQFSFSFVPEAKSKVACITYLLSMEFLKDTSSLK